MITEQKWIKKNTIWELRQVEIPLLLFSMSQTHLFIPHLYHRIPHTRQGVYKYIKYFVRICGPLLREITRVLELHHE